MRVLVLNCGSSSVKFAVIDTQTKESISSGLVENIGVNGHVKAKGPEGNIDFNFDCPTHAEAVAEVQKFLSEQKLIETIEAIGHRVKDLSHQSLSWTHAAAAAAKSLQSCLTLCDPIDGSPPGSPVPGILSYLIN